MSNPSKKPNVMVLPRKHLTSSAIRAWRPEKPSEESKHLMSCPSCRHAVGRALLFRGLISPPKSSHPIQHLSTQDIRNFHRFVMLSDSSCSIEWDKFTEMVSHFNECTLCLALLIDIDQKSKITLGEAESILALIKKNSAHVENKALNEKTQAVTSLGVVEVIESPSGITVDFLPYAERSRHNGLTTQRPRFESIKKLAAANELNRIQPRVKPITPKEIGETADLLDFFVPKDDEYLGVEIVTETARIQLGFTRYSAGTDVSVFCRSDNNSTGVGAFELWAAPENHRASREETKVVAQTDNWGRAWLRTPDVVSSSTSTSRRLSAKGWRLKVVEKSEKTEFELTIKFVKRRKS